MTSEVPFDMSSIPSLLHARERLKSFKDWPRQCKPEPSTLASAGFVYLGIEDWTMCAWCGVRVWKWEKTDDPLREHIKWSEDCPYVRMVCCYVQGVRVGFAAQSMTPTTQKEGTGEIGVPDKTVNSTKFSFASGFQQQRVSAPTLGAQQQINGQGLVSAPTFGGQHQINGQGLAAPKPHSFDPKNNHSGGFFSQSAIPFQWK